MQTTPPNVIQFQSARRPVACSCARHASSFTEKTPCCGSKWLSGKSHASYSAPNRKCGVTSDCCSARLSAAQAYGEATCAEAQPVIAGNGVQNNTCVLEMLGAVFSPPNCSQNQSQPMKSGLNHAKRCPKPDKQLLLSPISKPSTLFLLSRCHLLGHSGNPLHWCPVTSPPLLLPHPPPPKNRILPTLFTVQVRNLRAHSGGWILDSLQLLLGLGTPGVLGFSGGVLQFCTPWILWAYPGAGHSRNSLY